jgi:hypothetical protein
MKLTLSRRCACLLSTVLATRFVSAKADVQKSQWTFGYAVRDNDLICALFLGPTTSRYSKQQASHCPSKRHISIRSQCSRFSGPSASTPRPPPAPSQPAQVSPGNHTRTHSPNYTPTYRHTHTDAPTGSSNPTRVSTAVSASNTATMYHARPRSRHEGAGIPTSSARLCFRRH